MQPKQQPHRRIPFHVRQDVEKELERLESLDIIEKVTGPTPWVSPILVVPKSSGEVRICVDMREANKAVKREKHLMPTIDDLVTDLNGATIFSKLDLSSGYHQLELEPEIHHITTFSTHAGLRRYNNDVQYVSRYITEYATITAPLRALTKKEMLWQWSDKQQEAFDKLKDSLIKSHVMPYFNPAQETKVIVDASPVNLGGLLVQDNKVISYVS